MYALNPKSKFAQYAIRPALRVLTIELKKNPLTRLTIETAEDEVDLTELGKVKMPKADTTIETPKVGAKPIIAGMINPNE